MYQMIEDPGHAWLGVPVKELKELGIADKITAYSYLDRTNGIAWLEEDLDLATYARAKWPNDTRAHLDANVRKQYVDQDARIRYLPDYQP